MSTPSDPPAQPSAIPLCVPNISGREWEFVRSCLDAGWVSSSGALVDEFESSLARAVGAEHAVATTSGTAALHIALLLADVGPDDEVVLPSLTFVAPANAVRYVGAYPVFVDVDARHWQLDPEQFQTFLTQDCTVRDGRLTNLHTGRTVRAVLPVDILGHPVDLDAVATIAADHDLAVIEDATESLGASYRGRSLGSVSPVTAFSFNGNKLLTTGGGGMLVTDDDGLAERARYLTTQAKDDPVEFIHNEVGFNYRLTNLQAAVGLAQLERLEEFVAIKRRIAESYVAGLADLSSIAWLEEQPWARSACWLATMRLSDTAPVDRHTLARRLAERRIQTRPLWEPMHASRAHRASYARSCPVAESLRRRCVSLPSSTGLTDGDLARTLDAVRGSLT